MRDANPTDSLNMALARYQAQFNAGEYFESHETLEHVWLALKTEAPCEQTTALRLELQGLIQLAAGMIKWREGNFRGAERLFTTASAKLKTHPVNGLVLDKVAAIREQKPFQPFTLSLVDETPPLGDAPGGESSV